MIFMTKTKGRFGLSLAAVAMIAFGFAALQQPQSVLLVAGFALLAEKDDWLSRQALQALLLTIAYFMATLVTGWVFGGLAQIFGWAGIYSAASALQTVNTVAGSLLYIALVVFAVLAVLRVLRGKDAGLPFLAKMAGGDLATALQKSAKTKSAPTPPKQPPAGAPVRQEVSPGRHCSSCGTAMQEDSAFCTECGAKNE
jgi:MFS family permease